MKAGYLSSYRIPHPSFVADFIGGFEDKNVAVITNAKDDRNPDVAEPKIVGLEEYLRDLGMDTVRLDLRQYKGKYAALRELIEKTQILYAMGGSNNHLVDAMKGCNFEGVLDEYRGLYIGESAGAMALGGSYGCLNDFYESKGSDHRIQDGLGVIGRAIVPHVDSGYESVYKERGEFVRQHQDMLDKVLLLTDEQAVFVTDGSLQYIPEEAAR
jgi:peptidase E